MIRALALPLASCLILCLPLTAKVPASQAPMTQAPAPQAVVVKPPVSKKGPIKVAKPKPAPEAPAATGSVPETAPAPLAKPRVQLLTSYGPIVVELEPELAPMTVANFLQYVKEGHYRGTIFHRVIEGFMIQGGGMLENLEEKPSREPIPNEAPQTFNAGLKNTRGTIAMARTGSPHSASAQFYINVADNPSLDHRDLTEAGYGYCAFGRVVEGMEVVDRIVKVRTEWRRGMGDVPQFPVRLKDAVLLPVQ